MTDERDKPAITRRDLIGMGAAASALALTDAVLTPGILRSQDKPPQVPRRTLGKTGKQIPILLLGGAVGFDTKFDPKIAEAMRYGVNYVDAADCYDGGSCETAVGNFHTRLKARKDLWITSKSDAHDPQGFEQTVSTSLKKLKTDYIDMYYLHALNDAKVFTSELEAVVSKLKSTGKIRHFGFSCHEGNVVELLQTAAKTPWVESVMFRYNFRKYGDKALNLAMDAAHKAGVGLIAMKTQGSEVSPDKVAKFQKVGKWTKHQAVLKVVWEDPRITALVSHMDTFDKLRQNIAAALDKQELSQLERDAIDAYAAVTRASCCDGCEQHCGPAAGAQARVADTLRLLMYHDVYGEPGKARELYARLPPGARELGSYDLEAATRACPHGIDVAVHMRRALTVLG